MRKLIVSTLMTLDGVVEDPGGFSDFEHGGWGADYFDEQAQRLALDTLEAADAFLCGRTTYEAFSRFWPSASGPYADRLNALRTYVASTTLHGPLDWNATVIDGDAVAGVAELKQQPGQDIVMYGSTKLMATLMPHDLIDEYRIWVHPVVVGSGHRLFDDPQAGAILKLVDTRPLDAGIVVLTYRPSR